MKTRFLTNLAAAVIGAGMMWIAPALAEATIQVGVLHSLSATLSISEPTPKAPMLMHFHDTKPKTGLLGMIV